MKNESKTSPAQALALERFALVAKIQDLLRQSFPLAVALEQVSSVPVTLPEGPSRLFARRTLEDWWLPPHQGPPPATPPTLGRRHQMLRSPLRQRPLDLPAGRQVTDFSPGPYRHASEGTKAVPTFLCVIIDDHSRLLPFAAYFLRADTQAFLQTLKEAIRRRGLPAKLYTDQGGPFTNDHTRIVCARLGIRLLHALSCVVEGVSLILHLVVVFPNRPDPRVSGAVVF